jgi:CRP-like cAMP-binding protein
MIVLGNTNRLLNRLPPTERARFIKACAPVQLGFGETIAQAGRKIAHVYLPITAYVSIIRPIDDDQIEVALAGHEGMVGWSLGLDSGVSEMRALVQGPGEALRMSSKAFNEQMGGSLALRSTIAGYTSVLMTQFAQTAGCNRFHVVEQRLARWLLMTSDRARSDTFRVTQEFLSAMLGVRRAGVSEAAGRLQVKGHVRYRRGEIHIRDRIGLEAASCSCYRVNNATYTRVLGQRA